MCLWNKQKKATRRRAQSNTPIQCKIVLCDKRCCHIVVWILCNSLFCLEKGLMSDISPIGCGVWGSETKPYSHLNIPNVLYIRIWRTFIFISCFDCIEFGVWFDWCFEICHLHQLYKCERSMNLCFLHLKNYLKIFLFGREFPREFQRILSCFIAIVPFFSK